MTEANDQATKPPCNGKQTRRSFMGWLVGGMAAVATALVAVPFVAYLFGALLKKTPKLWLDAGPVDDYPEMQMRRFDFDNPISVPWDGMVSHTGVYIYNLGKDASGKEKFRVLAVNCAHLGCPVSFFKESGLFMCPCHGGVYYEDGARASGPPPRGLYPYVWRIQDGRLQLQAPHLPTLQDTLLHPEEV